jgi:hypothetical protein
LKRVEEIEIDGVKVTIYSPYSFTDSEEFWICEIANGDFIFFKNLDDKLKNKIKSKKPELFL